MIGGLDKPTSGEIVIDGKKDSKTRRDVLDILKTTSTIFQQTIIMITHDEHIAQLADRIIHIEDGKIKWEGRGFANGQ